MTAENVETQQVSDMDKAMVILSPMFERNATEDEMVVALIQSGIKFTVAGRLLAKAQESRGMRKSAKERFTEASELLVNWGFAPVSWDDVEEAAQSIADEVDATSVAQAMSCIKRFAKEHEITLPEKPKTTGTRGGGMSTDRRFYAWSLANPKATMDDVLEYCAKLDVSEKARPMYVTWFTDRFQWAHDLAKLIA